MDMNVIVRRVGDMCRESRYIYIFFFNDTATTEIYTLSLHDALPIYLSKIHEFGFHDVGVFSASAKQKDFGKITFATIGRSEEHTSELQSH